MSYLVGSGLTPYGKHEGSSTLGLMSQASNLALKDSGLLRSDIDGVICGYSTTMPHLMLATLFCEHYGINPKYAHSVQMGGATGLGLVMLASQLVLSGVARRILVVGGENRMTGQSRDSAIQVLAQVGHPEYEVPLGATIPAYYGLLASSYMQNFGSTENDFAALAVLMRQHASLHPGAQFKKSITEEEVLASRPIASPLKILDCCSVADGGCAVVVSSEPIGDFPIKISGSAQHHNAQHITAMKNLHDFGAGQCTQRALLNAGRKLSDMEYIAIYDSFTITLTMLLEEIGLAPRGQAGNWAREGRFSKDSNKPLNLHGGLLSYGHCGVAGAMAHIAESHFQMTGRSGKRQTQRAGVSLLHADGGVLSSHVSLVLESL
jgi:acetyl-CoA acetyltransferase